MENTRNSAVTPPVAVIILNWNGEALLRRFLPQVLDSCNSRVSRIIVADNGSTDASCELIEREFPAVELWRFDRNYGFAEGYNRAVAQAAAYPYVVLLNSDATGVKGWDSALYEYMEAHPEVGACQPKILAADNPGYFEYAGAAGGLLDCNGYPYCRGRIFAVCEGDHGQYNDTASVHWASGAALMVRRELFIACGGLDKYFFAHMEEIDLCWRIRLAGYRISAVGTASVLHLGGASLDAANPRKTYLNFRNNLLMLHKNLPDSCRGRILMRRRMLDTFAWGMYVLTLKWKHAAAVFKAHRDFARMRSNYTTHPAENLIGTDKNSRRNILISYYLHGRRKYSEL